jgi:hypothetical protein
VFGTDGWICTDAAAAAEVVGAGFRLARDCGVAAA